jgi:hypothetical protein
MDLAGMVQVNIERQEFSLGEHLRRVAVPVQSAEADFAVGGQFLDRLADGGEKAVVKKPGDRRGGEQRDDELHEQEPAQIRACKRRHAARR